MGHPVDENLVCHLMMPRQQIQERHSYAIAIVQV
jgi:hypothetical protein